MNILFYLLQKEFGNYIKMIESMTLKRNIENKMLKNLNLDNQVHDNEGQGQRLPTNIGVPTDTVLRIWNYITFFIITTYSRGLKEESSYNGISKALKSGSSYEVDLKGESYYDADLKSESCYDAGLKGESCYKEELKSESSYKACSNMRDEASRIVKIFTQAYLEGSKHNADERIHEIEFFFPSQEEEFSDCLEDIMSEISKTITEARGEAFGNKVLMLNLLLKAISFKPRPIHFILFVLVQLRRAIKDMHNLMKHIGVTLGAEGESKCVYNMMNLYLHFLILNGRIVLTKDERQLIAAVSALHPLQDDYIDKENLTREVLDIITFKLQGYEFNSSQGCKSNYPEKRFNGILKLIDIIYSHYPINHHPDLVYIFCELQRWQCKSLQQKVGCTLTELLQISFMKGGYAFALFGYIALGKMSPSQFGYFFSMGAIFQLLDDLKDIEEDLDTNVNTVWTIEMLKNGTLDKGLMGVISIQREFEKMVNLLDGFLYPVLVRRVELFGCRFEVFKCYCKHNKLFSKRLADEIQKCMPFKVEDAIEIFKHYSKINTVEDFLTDFTRSVYEIFKYLKLI